MLQRSPEIAATSGASDLSSEIEVDSFRRLFPLQFHERHLVESIRPDGRPLGKARDTTVMLGEHYFLIFSVLFLSRRIVTRNLAIMFLGAVASTNGSALVKIGSTVSPFFGGC